MTPTTAARYLIRVLGLLFVLAVLLAIASDAAAVVLRDAVYQLFPHLQYYPMYHY